MSLTVTRPGRRPPYRGSACADDIVKTSKASSRPCGVPGHIDNRTLGACKTNRVCSAGWFVPTEEQSSAADGIVSDYFDRGGQPAIAYGIVSGGELVHRAGFGARFRGGPPPDADTVFRIASMSKSFTASAILLLRDEGRLAL